MAANVRGSNGPLPCCTARVLQEAFDVPPTALHKLQRLWVQVGQALRVRGERHLGGRKTFLIGPYARWQAERVIKANFNPCASLCIHSLNVRQLPSAPSV